MEISKMWHVMKSTVSGVIRARDLSERNFERLTEEITGIKTQKKILSKVKLAPYNGLYLCKTYVISVFFKCSGVKCYDDVSEPWLRPGKK